MEKLLYTHTDGSVVLVHISSSREPFAPTHGDQQDPFWGQRTSPCGCGVFLPADTTDLTTALTWLCTGLEGCCGAEKGLRVSASKQELSPTAFPIRVIPVCSISCSQRPSPT